uniref:non-specific serine/threonine protein kinase n=1 Tax=Kalanchoe fedtschenkoi TaxID=63787 RepID=A0A7N0TN44_KALFE
MQKHRTHHERHQIPRPPSSKSTETKPTFLSISTSPMAAATSLISGHLPRPKKLRFSPLLPALFCLCFIPSTSSLTFNITDFSQSVGKFRFGDGGDFFNNASIESGRLVVTKMVNWTTGRATYTDSVRLWDAASGSLADFSTRFTFLIDSSGAEPYSDGLAFFLAPLDFPLPDTQEGSGLGLVSGQYLANSSLHPFLAVEFDTFGNGEFKDFAGDHVGIDISSMESVAGVKWKSGVLDGKVSQAWVEYRAATKALSVVVTGFEANATVLQSVNYTVDLRTVLPEWVCIGFSAGTGAYSELHSIQSWSFDSMLVDLNETDNMSPAPQPPDSAQERRNRNNTGLIAGVVCGAIVAVIGLTGMCVWRRRCGQGRGKARPANMDEEFAQTGPKKYSYKELDLATGHFAEENKLGEGGFGGVYKGMIKDTAVAVKRVSKGSHQGVKEYVSEVQVISQLRHRNLVQLSGWCHEGDELLLVYEFMPNGSLDTHLFKSQVALTWDSRYRIAQSLASAILYLHEECDRYVIHRDIKSSNVMLDSAFNAKLGDFGLARLVDHQKVSETTVLAGTRGYIDPESVLTGRTTKQSDVYSFGVVVLELACGRQAIDLLAPEDEVSLVDWVYDLNQEGRLFDVADPKLNQAYDRDEFERLVIVGLWCAMPVQASRPSIRQAILVLNSEAPLPVLPDRAPNSLSYFNRPLAGFNDTSSTQASSRTYTEPSSVATTSSSL